MLHILSIADTPGSAPALRGMFEARKRVFIDLLGWDVPVIDGRYEVDQFDDAYCTYLILTDEEGNHLASCRLLPTTRAHILGSLYPHLCDGPPPRSRDIFEVTRFCLERNLANRDRRRARDTLVCALADHALSHNIRAYSAIAERGWVEQISGFGWRTRILGPARREGRNLLAALRIEIDADTPRQLRDAGLRPDALLAAGQAREAA